MRPRDMTWPVAFTELSFIVKPCASGVCGLAALSDPCVDKVQSATVLCLHTEGIYSSLGHGITASLDIEGDFSKNQCFSASY